MDLSSSSRRPPSRAPPAADLPRVLLQPPVSHACSTNCRTAGRAPGGLLPVSPTLAAFALPEDEGEAGGHGPAAPPVPHPGLARCSALAVIVPRDSTAGLPLSPRWWRSARSCQGRRARAVAAAAGRLAPAPHRLAPSSRRAAVAPAACACVVPPLGAAAASWPTAPPPFQPPAPALCRRRLLALAPAPHRRRRSWHSLPRVIG
jgi:hypothetical protein